MTARKLLSAVLALLALSGCVDVEEEVTIGRTGPTRLRFEIGIPDELRNLSGRYTDEDVLVACRRELNDFRARLKEDTLTWRATVREWRDGDTTRLEVVACCWSALAFADSPPLPLQLSSPQYGLLQVQIEPYEATRYGPVWGPAVGLLQRLTGDHRTRVTLHAPRILDSNGDLSLNHRTVTWDVPTAALLTDTGPPMTAELRLFDWRAIAAEAGLALLLGLTSLGLAIKRRRSGGAWRAQAATGLAALLGTAYLASPLVTGYLLLNAAY